MIICAYFSNQKTIFVNYDFLFDKFTNIEFFYITTWEDDL